MTDEQLQTAPGPDSPLPDGARRGRARLQHADVTRELKFTGPVLADIFLGKITKWNDPAIAKLNPGVKLPATDITVVHRSDGSGTTYIWVDYLSKISPEWKTEGRRRNSSVNWPVGVGGKGNEGVSGLVTQTPGSIGYVELVYALQNKIGYGAVQNRAGEFVKAIESSRSPRRPPAPRRACRPISACRSPTRRARALSDLVVHLDSAVRESERQGARARSWSTS